jgi:hypothetical protein
MWLEFAQGFTPRESRTWSDRRSWANVAWSGAPPPPGTPVHLHHWNGRTLVLSADGIPLGTLQATLNPNRHGLARAVVSQDFGRIDLTYLGPDDLSAA